MASIGEINSKNIAKAFQNERPDMPVKVFFGVFFDGTGNNMIQTDRAKALKKELKKKKKEISKDELLDANRVLDLSQNGANSIDKELRSKKELDFSNVAVLHNSYIGLSERQREKIEKNYKVYVFNIYVQGAGTNEGWADNKVGAGFGLGRTGVPALVTETMNLINIVINGLHIKYELDNWVYFDVFGFSRGATCARMFSHYVNGDLEITRSYKELGTLKKTYLSQFKPGNRKVAILGLYDTVSSIGINYDNNNREYGLYSPNEEWVEHTFHICALDEFRDHFRLTDVGDSVKNKSLELYLPGCHTDIGGGYKSGNEKMRIKYACKELSVNFQDYKIPEYKQTSDIPLHICKSIKDHDPQPITMRLLTEMGWYDINARGYSYWDDSFNNIYNITRILKRGYSNIPLTIMRTKAETATKREMFVKNIEPRFSQIDNNVLSAFKRQIESQIDSAVLSGRYTIIPCKEDYRKIRAGYLHFSASDSLIVAGEKTSLVNSPTITNRMLNRIVYHGNMDDMSSDYLYSDL